MFFSDLDHGLRLHGIQPAVMRAVFLSKGFAEVILMSILGTRTCKYMRILGILNGVKTSACGYEIL